MAKLTQTSVSVVNIAVIVLNLDTRLREIVSVELAGACLHPVHPQVQLERPWPPPDFIRPTARASAR